MGKGGCLLSLPSMMADTTLIQKGQLYVQVASLDSLASATGLLFAYVSSPGPAGLSGVVQRSDELSPPFALVAQRCTRQFLLVMV